MACFIGIQGGQAFQHDRETLESIPREVHRITLVHLTNSRIGSTSSPLGRDHGALFGRGRELVEVMNTKRCLVDLAHINPAGFWSALDAHSNELPVACTHTGVDGVHPHWRNLDDQQLKAVANTGGVTGVIFHGGFLAGSPFRCQPEKVVEHLEHIIAVAGENSAAIGTDYDGMIVPPYRLEDVTKLPVLVQIMRDRKWPERQIRKVLGENAQHLFDAIRP
jgi:membrane dipeptidase